MYRPTVRYNDVYKLYVDQLFKLTGLDRNKIIRCCMFTSAFNPEFLKIIEAHKHEDVPLPSPLWAPDAHYLWMEQDGLAKEKGGVGDANTDRKTTITEAPKLHQSKRTTGSNGISFTREEQEKKSPSARCEQSSQGLERSLPIIQLSGNGGIKLDFR
ncbi:hypothetical protein ABEY96_28205 [Priestia aryabhattai]|uniref:hypothetical protein n=1 Tax=Priestia aryabhattai TaxID=412384 RepID=UPI003D267071